MNRRQSRSGGSNVPPVSITGGGRITSGSSPTAADLISESADPGEAVENSVDVPVAGVIQIVSSGNAEPATVRRQPDSRIPWRDLLLRVFREDVLACPCGARRKVVAFIDERSVIEQILGHLGLPTTGPPTAPARLRAHRESPQWRDDIPELQQSLR